MSPEFWRWTRILRDYFYGKEESPENLRDVIQPGRFGPRAKTMWVPEMNFLGWSSHMERNPKNGMIVRWKWNPEAIPDAEPIIWDEVRRSTWSRWKGGTLLMGWSTLLLNSGTQSKGWSTPGEFWDPVVMHAGWFSESSLRPGGDPQDESQGWKSGSFRDEVSILNCTLWLDMSLFLGMKFQSRYTSYWNPRILDEAKSCFHRTI